jgi:hypothetical protein
MRTALPNDRPSHRHHRPRWDRRRRRRSAARDGRHRHRCHRQRRRCHHPSGNATSFGSVGTQPNRAVEIDCQIYGEPVTGKFGRSLIWDHVPGKGYISDS